MAYPFLIPSSSYRNIQPNESPAVIVCPLRIENGYASRQRTFSHDEGNLDNGAASAVVLSLCFSGFSVPLYIVASGHKRVDFHPYNAEQIQAIFKSRLGKNQETFEE